MHFLELPVIVIEHIFSYLSFDEIAKNRIVCKDFDSICQRALNRGFLMIERRHAMSLKAIKAQLPRRESERRFHTLSRHCDILTSIETRLSMLTMAYGKFIDNNVCCFIPGKVIDEIRRVLHVVEEARSLPRAHEVLQELRDISSMAIEHFDERISPGLRLKMLTPPARAPTPAPCAQEVSSLTAGAGLMQSVEMVTQVRAMCSRGRKAMLLLTRKHNHLKRKLRGYRLKMHSQRKQLVDWTTKKLAEQNSHIGELKKRIEECDVKYQELTQSQGGIKVLSSSGAVEACGGNKEAPVFLKNFSSQIRLDPSLLAIGTKRKLQDAPNIKPRKTTVDLPSAALSSQSDAGPSSTSVPKRQKTTSDVEDQTQASQNLHKLIEHILTTISESSEGKGDSNENNDSRSELITSAQNNNKDILQTLINRVVKKYLGKKKCDCVSDGMTRI